MHCDFVVVRVARIAHLRIHSFMLPYRVLCSSPSASYFIRAVMHVAIYIVSVVSRSTGVQCVLLVSLSSSVSVFSFTRASFASTLPFTFNSEYVTRYLHHCVHSRPIPTLFVFTRFSFSCTRYFLHEYVAPFFCSLTVSCLSRCPHQRLIPHGDHIESLYNVIRSTHPIESHTPKTYPIRPSHRVIICRYPIDSSDPIAHTKDLSHTAINRVHCIKSSERLIRSSRTHWRLTAYGHHIKLLYKVISNRPHLRRTPYGHQ